MIQQEAESVIILEKPEVQAGQAEVQAPESVAEVDTRSQTTTAEVQDSTPPVTQKKKKKKKKMAKNIATQETAPPQAPSAFGLPLTNVAVGAAIVLGGIGYAMFKSSGNKTSIAAV